jgi:hypothetical protein
MKIAVEFVDVVRGVAALGEERVDDETARAALYD